MKVGELRVRTQKCSLCEWTMPSWFETPEEVKAAFMGHVTTRFDGKWPCSKAILVPIPGAADAPVGKVAAILQSICENHGLPLQVTSAASALIQTPDSKCGHS